MSGTLRERDNEQMTELPPPTGEPVGGSPRPARKGSFWDSLPFDDPKEAAIWWYGPLAERQTWVDVGYLFAGLLLGLFADNSAINDESAEADRAAAEAAERPVDAASVHAAGGKTRTVWEYPVIWREMRTWVYGRKVLLIRTAYLVLFALAAEPPETRDVDAAVFGKRVVAQRELRLTERRRPRLSGEEALVEPLHERLGREIADLDHKAAAEILADLLLIDGVHCQNDIGKKFAQIAWCDDTMA